MHEGWYIHLENCEERGLLTCRGKKFIHENSITCLLEVVILPREVEIIHVKGHQSGYSEEKIGKKLGNGEVQKAALLTEVSGILLLLPVAQPLLG